MKKLIIGGLAALAIASGTGIGVASEAHADPGIGCETIRWGFLGSQRRTICDGPTRPDGSWTRARVVWTPAHYVPARSYCGTYLQLLGRLLRR